MIKIQQHLDENPANAAATLRTLAQEHWKYLNPNTAQIPVRLKTTALIRRCEQVRDGCLTDNFRKKYNLTKITAIRVQRFFSNLLLNDSILLQEIILSEPVALIDSVHPLLEKMLPNRLLYVKQDGAEKQTKLGLLLSEKIFNYARFRASAYCAQLYRQKMNGNLHTCPYCNLNPITITKLKNGSSLATKQRAYLDIDHFYPKVRFPYFAVSFFNLIPSCHDCNASLKGTKNFSLSSHVHPYVHSFDDLHEFRLNSIALSKGKVSIEAHTRVTGRVDKTIEDLDLVDRYNSDTQTVTDILKYYKANYHHLNHLNLIHSKFFFSHFPFKKSHILRKQRAKLLRDIFSQIGGTDFILIE